MTCVLCQAKQVPFSEASKHNIVPLVITCLKHIVEIPVSNAHKDAGQIKDYVHLTVSARERETEVHSDGA
jgi:hypothetical protein